LFLRLIFIALRLTGSRLANRPLCAGIQHPLDSWDEFLKIITGAPHCKWRFAGIVKRRGRWPARSRAIFASFILARVATAGRAQCMQVQVPTPDMQHGEEADFRAQVFGIAGKGAQGWGDGAEQDVASDDPQNRH
jgi:hypothetical protein